VECKYVRALNTRETNRKKKGKRETHNTAMRRDNETARLTPEKRGARRGRAPSLSLSYSVPPIELRNNDQYCGLPDFSVLGLREWGSFKVRPAQCDHRPRQQEIERARPSSSNDLMLFGAGPIHILYTLACEWSNVKRERERERERERSERPGRASGIRGIVYYLPQARNREQFPRIGH